MTTYTVERVRHLRPYSILKGAHYEDPYVRDIFESCVDPDTLNALDQYTRGMYDIDMHYESFMKYSRPVSTDREYGNALINHPSFTPALNRVIEDLSFLSDVKIIPPNELDRVVWNPSTAAGFGYIGLKRDNYHQARRNATRALYDFDKYRENYRFVPDKAFARSQLALRAHPKIRHVWGRAFHHILLEGCIACPIIEALLLNDNPIFTGRDIHKDMPTAIHKLVREGQWTYCLDFSSFDSSLSRTMIDVAWSILEHILDLTDEKSKLLFDFSRFLFQHTPLVMPDGYLYKVYAGVPSGTYFTQLIDSICNLLLIYMLQHHFKCESPVYVLGDDSIFAHPTGDLKFEQIKEFFMPFGMTASEKSVIVKNFLEIIFLGHNFYGSRVTRDEFTCLSLALYSEDEIDSIHQTATRLASLIYDCGYNSFGLYRTYKILLGENDIDWTHAPVRPVTVSVPFIDLFMLG